jgi:hypothetical protein
VSDRSDGVWLTLTAMANECKLDLRMAGHLVMVFRRVGSSVPIASFERDDAAGFWLRGYAACVRDMAAVA